MFDPRPSVSPPGEAEESGRAGGGGGAADRGAGDAQEDVGQAEPRAPPQPEGEGEHAGGAPTNTCAHTTVHACTHTHTP